MRVNNVGPGQKGPGSDLGTGSSLATPGAAKPVENNPYANLALGNSFDSLFAPQSSSPVTCESFEGKHGRSTTIGSTTLTVQRVKTEGVSPNGDAASPVAVYRIELEGPSVNTTPRSLFNLMSGPSPEQRNMALELCVGSERCPDWDHANLFLTAIQDLIKLTDGCMTDEVVKALKTHMTVVS
jgi:hypothetical protein